MSRDLKLAPGKTWLRFVLAAQDATATGDTRKPQMLLGRMLQTCVACHASYRLG